MLLSIIAAAIAGIIVRLIMGHNAKVRARRAAEQEIER